MQVREERSIDHHRPPSQHRVRLRRRTGYITQLFFKVVLQKSIPTQIRQLILYITYSKGCLDGFVGESTSAKRF